MNIFQSRLFLIKKISANFVKIGECFDLTSDHSFIILTLGEKNIRKGNRPTLANGTIEWGEYRKDLSHKTKERHDYETERSIIDIRLAVWDNTKK